MLLQSCKARPRLPSPAGAPQRTRSNYGRGLHPSPAAMRTATPIARPPALLLSQSSNKPRRPISTHAMNLDGLTSVVTGGNRGIVLEVRPARRALAWRVCQPAAAAAQLHAATASAPQPDSPPYSTLYSSCASSWPRTTWSLPPPASLLPQPRGRSCPRAPADAWCVPGWQRRRTSGRAGDATLPCLALLRRLVTRTPAPRTPACHRL